MSHRKKPIVYSSEADSDEESDRKVPLKQFKSSESEDSSEDEKDEINGKQSEGSEIETGPSTQHRNMLLSQVKSKIKRKSCQTDVPAGFFFEIPTKLALVNRLKEVNTRKTSTYKTAINKLDWSKVKIDDHSEAELKEILKSVLSAVCSVRTLDEMLNDYLQHYQKYEMKLNKNAPKLPVNPCMRYVSMHREEFTRKLKKKFPNETIKLGRVSKYGSEKYNKLPEKEKERYQQQYKEELETYRKLKANLIRDNPELKKKSAPRPAAGPRPPRTKKAKEHKVKEEPIITPFKIFYQEIKDSGEPLKYQQIQQMYKHLSDPQKLQYINKVIALDTPLEKLFTIDEKKMMKHSSGMPQRPLSSYNSFVREQNYGDQKLSMKEVSELWKKLSDEEKKYHEDKAKEDNERWKEEMLAWIKTLPVEQQAEHLAKNKLLNGDKRKRKRADTVDVKVETNKPSVIQEVQQEDRETSPKKKKKNWEIFGGQTSPLMSPKNEKPEKKNEEIVSSQASPLKNEKPGKKDLNDTNLDFDRVLNMSKTSSPKKESFEKIIASLGPFPSLTTAHYFYQTKCEGKSAKKASKAYNNLSKSEKEKLRVEMKKVRNDYLAKLTESAGRIGSKHQNKVISFHKVNKEEQASATSWHKPDHTDDEQQDGDDDSSEDDDSDDS